MKLTSTGSEDVYLGRPSDLKSVVTVFQIDIPAAWSGSLTPLRVVAGAPTPLLTSFSRLQDGTVLSGSLNTSGSYFIETTGSEVYLRHAWVSGAVDIYIAELNDA